MLRSPIRSELSELKSLPLTSAQVIPEVESKWTEILSCTKLGPHRRHFFQLTNIEDLAFTHIRVTIFPDGGIKRIRVHGKRASAEVNGSIPPVISSSNGSIPQDHLLNGVVANKPGNPYAERATIALPLTQEAFVDYGSVIQAYADVNAAPRHVRVTGVNQGTAIKFAHTFAKVRSSFPVQTMLVPGFAVYRAQPTHIQSTFQIRLLERHPHNNQAFFVIGSSTKLWDDDAGGLSNRYLAVVAKGGDDDQPDLSTLRAFVASTSQGILYDTGTWHHPLIALDSVSTRRQPTGVFLICSGRQLILLASRHS